MTDEQLQQAIDRLDNEIYALRPGSQFSSSAQAKIARLEARLDKLIDERDARRNPGKKRWRPTGAGQSILVPPPAPLRPKAKEQLDLLIDAAQAHGEESDPDHEVGDLQEMLTAVWELLPQSARDDVYDDFMELIDEWL